MSQTKDKKASRVWKQCAVIFLKLLLENLNSWIFDHHKHSDHELRISFGNLLLDSYGKYGTKCDRLVFLAHTACIIENK